LKRTTSGGRLAGTQWKLIPEWGLWVTLFSIEFR
jgi:hypothetical protein